MYNRYLPCVSIQASEVEEEEEDQKKKRLDVRACMRLCKYNTYNNIHNHKSQNGKIKMYLLMRQ